VQATFRYPQTANSYFSQPPVLVKLSAAANETLSFLTLNQSSVDPTGAYQPRERWWPEQFDARRADFAAIDLRGVRMRQRALAYGLAHYLGYLEEHEVLPTIMDEDDNYINDVSNLACLRVHERLMEYYFERVVRPYPDADKLKKAFLLKPKTKIDALHPRFYTMATLGLWKITQEAPKRPRTIDIGPAALTFHLKAYAPAIERLLQKPLLRYPREDQNVLTDFLTHRARRLAD
jgi:hypothetical protein